MENQLSSIQDVLENIESNTGFAGLRDSNDDILKEMKNLNENMDTIISLLSEIKDELQNR